MGLNDFTGRFTLKFTKVYAGESTECYFSSLRPLGSLGSSEFGFHYEVTGSSDGRLNDNDAPF